ncbi:MAG TPA: hypothetical protein PK472_07585, partial [Pseudomonadota bacterium]|nr:hypothetical protein [Pseudomonadota bacterium]
MKTHAPRPWLSSSTKWLSVFLFAGSLGLLLATGGLFVGCTDPAPASCAIGSLHCACTSGGGCDPGLACAADGLCASTSCGCNVSRACDSLCPCDPDCTTGADGGGNLSQDLATTPPND